MVNNSLLSKVKFFLDILQMPTRLSRFFPFLFVALWSTGFIGARLGLPHTEPMTFLLIRYIAVIACNG